MKSLKILNSLLALSSMFVRWLHVGSLKFPYTKIRTWLRPFRVLPENHRAFTLNFQTAFIFEAFSVQKFILYVVIGSITAFLYCLNSFLDIAVYRLFNSLISFFSIHKNFSLIFLIR